VQSANGNHLGKREPSVYGSTTLDELETLLHQHAHETSTRFNRLHRTMRSELVIAVAWRIFAFTVYTDTYGSLAISGAESLDGRQPDPWAAQSGRADSGRGAIVDRAEATMDVVVDHADVLHERVDARRPDEAITLILQLFGERLCLRRRLGQVGYGPRRPRAVLSRNSGMGGTASQRMTALARSSANLCFLREGASDGIHIEQSGFVVASAPSLVRGIGRAASRRCRPRRTAAFLQV
jgi:Dehydroquinase class II